LALIEKTREEIKSIQDKTQEIINQKKALEQELATIKEGLTNSGTSVA